MSNNDVWYGYLDAGDKSSPVVRDLSLETSSQRTIYLYNHKRCSILEYSREIVEPKLRELDPQDIPLKELASAFKAARKAFLAGTVIKRPEREVPVSSPPVFKEPDKVDEDYDDDFDEAYEDDQLEA